MPTLVFPALMTGDLTAGYRADIVDLPEVSIAKPTASEVLAAIREALLAALSSRERQGLDCPDPTPVEALGERLRATGAVLLLVDVQVEETPVRVNISIGDRLLRRLDEAAEAQNMTRSGFIASAVRQRLAESGRGERSSAAAGSQRLQEEVAELGRRLNEALGPDSTFGRTVAELDGRALEGLRALADSVASAVRRKPQRPPEDPR